MGGVEREEGGIGRGYMYEDGRLTDGEEEGEGMYEPLARTGLLPVCPRP